jgi:hypothetical protein
MGKLFDTIYESVLAVNNVGGYKAGEIVEFKQNYKSSPTYKDMSLFFDGDKSTIYINGIWGWSVREYLGASTILLISESLS